VAIFNPFGGGGDTQEAAIETGEKVLISFSPAKFDIFTKVLALFNKSTESIKIQSSTIIQKFGPATASADVSKLFDDQVVDLEIIKPDKYIKLFKQFRNNDDIKVIDDITNKRYIITNDEIKLFLPKQADAVTDDTMMPDFEDAEGLFELKIDKETSKQLVGLSAGANYVEYLIQDSKLKGIHIPSTAIYLFSEFLKDPKAKTLDETNADQIFRTGNFLTVPAEDFVIQIGKLKKGTPFSLTTCNTGVVNVTVFENLDDTSGGNVLI
jgi:hypothetical protein